MHRQTFIAGRNESHSFVLSSNRRGATIAFTISNSHLRALGLFAIIGFTVAVCALVDYISLRSERHFHRQVHEENQTLQTNMQTVKSQLESLESHLERTEKSVEKTQRITDLSKRKNLLKLAAHQKIKHVGDSHSGPQGGPFFGTLHSQIAVPTDAEDILDETHDLPLLHGRTFPLAERVVAAIDRTQSLEHRVLSLIETLGEQRKLMGATPNIRPTRGWYSSRFGYRVDPFTGEPALHNGLDFAARPGNPVWATANGIVRFVGRISGYGKIVIIDHGYGLETRYAHNSHLKVEKGDKVERRQLIALTGSSGRSTGPHLHYEVRVNGAPVDPTNFILEME